MNQSLRNFWQRSLSDKWLLGQSFFLLGVSRLAIKVLAFRRLAGQMGRISEESAGTITDEELSATRRVSWAVTRASQFTPWKSNCFPQAITAQYLLRRRGISSTLYLGCLMRNEGGMKAHAWLRSGQRIVTGRDGHRAFTVVARFADGRDCNEEGTQR
ncbi:MAG: lasso peptide biosynthesis B2 protein [Planctomycetaceae bacterium]|nr:lasso peptide biosynthesis B2 protein [Planctomycetaceae bacterium]